MSDPHPHHVDDPADETALERIVGRSPSRLGVGRRGTRPRTSSVLSFRADHARARDAVLTKVPNEVIEENGLLAIRSRISDQDEYLARPDLGRQLSEGTRSTIREECTLDPDVQVVVCDGLSSTAVEANVPDLLPTLVQGLEDRGFEVGTPLFVRFGRVDVMDVIGETLGANVVVNLIGERPGLNTAESLSAYLVYDPQPGEPTAKKSVISNIHADGIPAVEAGAQIVDLVETIYETQASGVDLA
ncbi:ethanolamine ammonia-lyase subunit EutC [Halalkalicoccus jeotgali]|uniref:Putative ethanolamine ammonia-lyase small subunit n=1 Tax=Halalkalicoccus jeotgali (strain DSM 18796 / CECT 7217 / JCM 14584 / KCTC 4019 / B3) TaxID=795797 RepID=D8JBD7_HALJB|nr:ethanolamine ammonia-lyase subunit EutC [Halalkalicoccus jeotgali]ADJ16590.1 ethanolamine ammonia-lyase small subunit [Halalkalicoccus jeotgali B3]ELY41313.1 ethanolamine ammonia-lyase small subunit [Halalkalicoccus jeotgali B3]